MDMSMGGMDMSMGGMSIGNGIPSLFTFQRMYWAVVGSAIAAFTLVNLYSYFLSRQRIRSTSVTPAKPKAFPFLLMATSTALVRELANASLPVFAIKSLRMPSPTLGKASIVGANMIVLLVMCFYKLDVSDQWSFENIGYRTGFVTLCQLPLLFLLAGKRNIIAALIGSSYERINWLHRWASRCFLLTATIHMGYWFADWAPYDYIGTKIRTDQITRRGVIAWAVLVWIVFSSMSPIRGWSYEFFVIQHIISFAVFIAFVYLHIPAEVKHWVWICVGLFFFDRVVRGFFYLYNNLSILHPSQRKSGDMGKLWALNAELTALPNNTTRVTINNPPISWSPGQHVFLSAQSLAPIQAHPFTISSIPSDGKMEFMIQSQKGGTRKFYQHAERLGSSLPRTSTDLIRTTSVAIEGPYGRIRPLQQFDSVVLLAGSSGASFTMPLLRDLVNSWKAVTSQSRSQREKPVTRHVRYVWIVKSGPQLSHFSVQLSQVMEDVARLRDEGHDVNVDISAYITCDDTFTTEQRTLLDAWKAHSTSTSTSSKHGSVTEVLNSVDDEDYNDFKTEKKFDSKDEKISIHEMDRYSMTEKTVPVTSKPSCGPNGTCCCTVTIEDEDDDDAIRPACTCNCGASSSRLDSTASSNNIDEKPKPKQPFLHPAISVFSGRPACRNVIRKTLEQAYGESAVVVCGPQGLVNDVRKSVVSLSDERAVHKGTGAQGIWLHAEAFGY